LCKKIDSGIGIFIGIILLNSLSFSQVELTAFGLYNINLFYPNQGDLNIKVESEISTWYSEWQAFFSTVLKQKSGPGFGGRITFNIIPSTGFEAGFEYIMAKTSFAKGLVEDLENRVESLGYLDWLETANRSGGNVIRYYGNVIFNFTSSDSITPYATAGLGLTHFKFQKQVGPEIEGGGSDYDESFHLHYLNSSALTLNGGLGIKTLFSPNFGLRIDARIFICDPDFEQILSLEILGSPIFEDEDSFIQRGIHIDTNLNIGLFARF